MFVGALSVILTLQLASAGCSWYWNPIEMRYTGAVQRAFQMYQERKEDLGPPRAALMKSVDEMGREQFVTDIEKFVHTKHAPEALYALKWFGDSRHAATIARALDAEDPEVRRVALSSFSRLTWQRFDDTARAKAWWSKHRERFPHSPADVQEKSVKDKGLKKL